MESTNNIFSSLGHLKYKYLSVYKSYKGIWKQLVFSLWKTDAESAWVITEAKLSGKAGVLGTLF